MGCTSSKADDSLHPLEEINDSDSEQFDVPDDVESYPDPIPPRNRKRDIYREEDYKKINTKARNAPESIATNYETLINYLTDGLQTDIEKLKAVFAWMGHQSVENRKFTTGKVNTPLDYMKRIKEKTGTCATFFTHICRKMGIPCVIIHGIAKDKDYEPGMDESTCNQMLRNSWTSVYVSNEWRLIFPSFADASSGVIGRQRNSKAKDGRAESATIDYFFLTDPEEFIYFALPDQQKWQLLDVHWPSQKFIDAPLCRPPYFLNDLKITSQYNCTLQSEDGECTVSLQLNEDMYFSYDMYYNKEQSREELSKDIQLDRYVFTNRTDSDWEVHIRFPQIGVYNMEVLAKKAVDINEVICEFRLVCDEIQDDVNPLPINPKLGFGPCVDTEKAGLKVVSHKEGMVNAVPHQKAEYDFVLTKDTYISTRLVHNTISSEELQGNITHKMQDTPDGKSLKVEVNVKEIGDYVLQVNAGDEDETGDEKYNCLNYLISSSRPENPTQKKARKNLQIKVEEQDVKGLEAAIKKFKELKLKNKGDLTKANKELEFLKVKQALRDAINRRHLETIKKALSFSNGSRCAGRPLIRKFSDQAEKLRNHLDSLGKICHDVMAMSQATINELRSYHTTSQVVKMVMTATYLLLGEVEEDVQTWEDIRLLLGKAGNQSLLYRVEHFDTDHVTPVVVGRVRDLVQDYDESSIRSISPGAGTFFVWVNKIIHMVEKWQYQQTEDNNIKES